MIDRINAPPSAVGLPPAVAAAQGAQPPGVLSKEMMDIFAKTAAAAISKKSPADSSGSGSGNTSEAATASNSRNATPPTTVPGSPATLRPTNTGVVGLGGASSKMMVAPPPPKLPTEAPPSTGDSQLAITSSELEAAKALMRIPGTVEQSGGEPMMGHWELVKPGELKKGASLAKALPEVVTKSADLSYDAYKAMAAKMSPPKVMRIPDDWDPRKEPVYLVVDPANVAASALPPTGAGVATMAPIASGALGATAVHLHKGHAAAAAPGLR